MGIGGSVPTPERCLQVGIGGVAPPPSLDKWKIWFLREPPKLPLHIHVGIVDDQNTLYYFLSKEHLVNYNLNYI